MNDQKESPNLWDRGYYRVKITRAVVLEDASCLAYGKTLCQAETSSLGRFLNLSGGREGDRMPTKLVKKVAKKKVAAKKPAAKVTAKTKKK